MYTDGDTICAFGTIIAIVGFAGIFAVDADKVDAVGIGLLSKGIQLWAIDGIGTDIWNAACSHIGDGAFGFQCSYTDCAHWRCSSKIVHFAIDGVAVCIVCHLYGCVVTKSHWAIKVRCVGSGFLCCLRINGDIAPQNKTACGTGVNGIFNTDYAGIVAFDYILTAQNIGVFHIIENGWAAISYRTNFIVSTNGIVTPADDCATRP